MESTLICCDLGTDPKTMPVGQLAISQLDFIAIDSM